MPPAWRIYYGDGSTVDSVDPYAAPGRDVQVILQPDPDVGRYVLCREHYYWWVAEDQQWHQGDLFGLWDYLAEPGPKKVVFGRSRDNLTFKAILARALADPDFAPKSATRAGEHL